MRASIKYTSSRVSVDGTTLTITSIKMATSTPARHACQSTILTAEEVDLFYQRLVLLGTLTSTQGGRSTPHRGAWHRFLDDLSSLCDSAPGGRTVVSIAVEDSSSHLRFWIAANSGQIKACEQLAWVLQNLCQLNSSQTYNSAASESEILRHTAYFSRRKIRNYQRWLRSYVRVARELESSRHAEGLS